MRVWIHVVGTYVPTYWQSPIRGAPKHLIYAHAYT